MNRKGFGEVAFKVLSVITNIQPFHFSMVISKMKKPGTY